MIRPALFIGLGSAGALINRALQNLFLEQFGKTSLPIHHFITIYTSQSDMPYVNRTDGHTVIYTSITEGKFNGIKTTYRQRPLGRWMAQNLMDIPHWYFEDAGAGGVPMVGRLYLWEDSRLLGALNEAVNLLGPSQLFARYDETVEYLVSYLTRTTDKDERGAREHVTQRLLNFEISPDVYLHGTIVGGTCSGMLYDVAYHLQERINNIVTDPAQAGGAGNTRLYLNLLCLSANLASQVVDSDGTKSIDRRRQAGNTYAALETLNYYVHPHTVYEEGFASFRGFEKNERRPFTEAYLHSPDSFIDDDGKYTQDRSHPSFCGMVAMNIFSDVVCGMADIKQARLIDAEPRIKENIYTEAFSRCGIAAIHFPKAAIAEAAAARFLVGWCSANLGERPDFPTLPREVNGYKPSRDNLEFKGLQDFLKSTATSRVNERAEELLRTFENVFKQGCDKYFAHEPTQNIPIKRFIELWFDERNSTFNDMTAKDIVDALQFSPNEEDSWGQTFRKHAGQYSDSREAFCRDIYLSLERLLREEFESGEKASLPVLRKFLSDLVEWLRGEEGSAYDVETPPSFEQLKPYTFEANLISRMVWKFSKLITERNRRYALNAAIRNIEDSYRRLRSYNVGQCIPQLLEAVNRSERDVQRIAQRIAAFRDAATFRMKVAKAEGELAPKGVLRVFKYGNFAMDSAYALNELARGAADHFRQWVSGSGFGSLWEVLLLPDEENSPSGNSAIIQYFVGRTLDKIRLGAGVAKVALDQYDDNLLRMFYSGSAFPVGFVPNYTYFYERWRTINLNWLIANNSEEAALGQLQVILNAGSEGRPKLELVQNSDRVPIDNLILAYRMESRFAITDTLNWEYCGRIYQQNQEFPPNEHPEPYGNHYIRKDGYTYFDIRPFKHLRMIADLYKLAVCLFLPPCNEKEQGNELFEWRSGKRTPAFVFQGPTRPRYFHPEEQDLRTLCGTTKPNIVEAFVGSLRKCLGQLEFLNSESNEVEKGTWNAVDYAWGQFLAKINKGHVIKVANPNTPDMLPARMVPLMEFLQQEMPFWFPQRGREIEILRNFERDLEEFLKILYRTWRGILDIKGELPGERPITSFMGP